ncbi:hypothetical protein [Arthrobacter sp. NPDC090010]|uniref:hypothetical protein n=1 Tax=Arthrobacter sp. NPDC090010 TaxID=3363942 RepID=UPI00380DC3FC
MSSSDFTQTRADEIVAGVKQNNVATFTGAVAFAPEVEPTGAAVAKVQFPADFAIDAATFSGNGTVGRVSATGGGQQAQLVIVKQDGAWKLDSTGSSDNITTAQ